MMGFSLCVVTNRTGFLLSKYRPRCPIIAITRDHRTARKVKIIQCIYFSLGYVVVFSFKL